MLRGGPGIYAQIHAASDGSSDLEAGSIKAANPALPHMPALAETIEREKKVAREQGGTALTRWRALRLNRGTAEVMDVEKSVSLENWRACVVKRDKMPPPEGPISIGFDLGGSASRTAFAVYWPETGRFEVFGAFGADPDVERRGREDEVGHRYVNMAARGEIRTYPGKVTPVGCFWRTWPGASRGTR